MPTRLLTFLRLLLWAMVLGSGSVTLAAILGLPFQAGVIKYIFVILLYTYIAALSIWNAEALDQYHFDRATFVLIVLFGIVRSRYDVPNEGYYKGAILILALIILAASIKNWRRIPKTNWRWAMVGLIACLLVIPLALIWSLYPDLFSEMTIPPGDFGFAIARELLYNFSFVVLFEEILFRGILWRHLRALGWIENKIFWGQAIIFWLLHLWQLGTPLTFFISVPIATFTFSLLARRSGQLLPSIIFHALSNTFILLLAYTIVN